MNTTEHSSVDEHGVPMDVALALYEWGKVLRQLGEALTARTLADAWIAGFVAARIPAGHAKGAFNGRFRPDLPFVIEFPCPFGHRTPDRYDIAKVRLIIEDNGWPTLDQASPCPRCTPDQLERWLLTCPRCEAGEVSDRHDPEHEALEVTDLEGRQQDVCPVAWVLSEFQRLRRIARARWWRDYPEEAWLAEFGDGSLGRPADKERFISMQLASASYVLDAVPKKRAALDAPSGVQTVDEAVVWLDGQKDDEGGVLVPVKASQREALRLTEGLPGRPRKNLIEEAQTKRKNRGTEA